MLFNVEIFKLFTYQKSHSWNDSGAVVLWCILWNQISFQQHWCIREQCEHPYNFTFVSVQFQPWEALCEYRGLHPGKPSTREPIDCTPFPPLCFTSVHLPAPWVTPTRIWLSIWFQRTFLLPLCSNLWMAPLSTRTCTSKLQVFSKVRGHIYYPNHLPLNHLAHVNFHFC